MTRERMERIVRTIGLERCTGKTLDDPGQAIEDLIATRERGRAIDDKERNISMRRIAAPVFNFHGEAVAGIVVSGPTAGAVWREPSPSR